MESAEQKKNRTSEITEETEDCFSEEKLPEVHKDYISSEMYALFARFERKREHKQAAASTTGEEGLLHYLVFQRDKVSPGFLKDELGVGSGRMADILRRLEQKQLIARTEDPKDSRKVIVSVTRKGRSRAYQTNEKVLEWYRNIMHYLGEEDSRELIRILRKLSEFQAD